MCPSMKINLAVDERMTKFVIKVYRVQPNNNTQYIYHPINYAPETLPDSMNRPMKICIQDNFLELFINCSEDDN